MTWTIYRLIRTRIQMANSTDGEGARTRIGMSTGWSTTIVLSLIGAIATNLGALYAIPRMVLADVARDYVRKDVQQITDQATLNLLSERLRSMSESLIELRAQHRTTSDKLSSLEREITSRNPR